MTTSTARQTTMPAPDLRMALLVMVNLAALPLFAGMPLSVTLLLLILGTWQFILIRTGRANPPRYILLLSVTTACAILFFAYGHLLGQRPGISLVIIMCVMKLFELKDMRDAYVVLYSACFVIASNFFYNQSVWLALYVCALIIILYSILISLSDRLQTTRLLPRLKQSARIFLYAIPLMLILFVLFPRIPGPLWGLPEDAFRNQTGLSEEMSPGSINQLTTSSEIAFRVRFADGRIPPHHERYWRGIVLTEYDGQTWRRKDAPESALPNIEFDEPGTDHQTRGRQTRDQQKYTYDVTLEPTNLDWLLTLEYPQSYETGYRMSREATVYRDKKINNVISYHVESAPGINRGLFPEEYHKYRLIPFYTNPDSVLLSTELLVAAKGDRQEYIQRVLNYFTEQDFIYTLRPEKLGPAAIDDFMLRTRSGFCEHFAGAFVYMMRLAGIPARVVVGYQGGTMNPLDDYMIVRQSDAHAWTEVWIDGRWRRYDPTATISPDRIEQGIAGAGLDLDRLPAMLVTDIGLLKDIAFLYDSFQNRWNQWVIGFDQDRQKRFMQWLGFTNTGASTLVSLLTVLLGTSSLIIAWSLFRGRRRTADTIQHYYERLCRKLERGGFRRAPNEGPRDFETRILEDTGLASDSRTELAYIFEAYRKMHYGNVNSDRLQAEYIKRVRRFKLARASRG